MKASPNVEIGEVTPTERIKEKSSVNITWKHLAPLIAAVAIALVPAPAGLAQHAWYFFAIFAGVIVGLMFEPLPGGAIGLIGVTVVTLVARWVLYGPADLAKPGFNPTNAALTWALSGFSNSTVWLIFGAFMFALGYEKTGLGRRIALLLVKAMGRKTLTLGYAVTIADTLLAPFTPSNTARSGGTIYPVIRNLPPLYDSKPNDLVGRDRLFRGAGDQTLHIVPCQRHAKARADRGPDGVRGLVPDLEIHVVGDRCAECDVSDKRLGRVRVVHGDDLGRVDDFDACMGRCAGVCQGLGDLVAAADEQDVGAVTGRLDGARDDLGRRVVAAHRVDRDAEEVSGLEGQIGGDEDVRPSRAGDDGAAG